MTPQNQQDVWARCPKCGLTFFREDEYRQYTVSSSSMPGGGLSPSDEVRQVKICICGEPWAVGPAGRRDKIDKSLQESLKMARKYRESRDPDKILAELALTFITQVEFRTLIERLDKLQAILKPPRAKEPDPHGP